MYKLLHLLRFAALALALPFCLPLAMAQTPWRLDCPSGTPALACTQLAADAFAAVHPGLALRTPEHLVISLDNGYKRLLADLEERLQVIALHPTARFVTVQERLSSGFRWHLVSLTSGTLTRVDGYPVFAPDGRHFFAVQSWTGQAAMPVIARLFEATHPVPTPKWRAACEDDSLWGLMAPQWRSTTELAFTQTGLPDTAAPLGQPAGEVLVKVVNGAWVPFGMVCSPAKKL
jgi:hypothetical protein